MSQIFFYRFITQRCYYNTDRNTFFQPPPYGECGSRPLKYFSEYSRENCLVECQTDYSVRICGCKMYFMPGAAKMCTLKETAMCQLLTRFPPNDSCKNFVVNSFCCCSVFLSSCNRTASDTNYWTIRTLFVA